MSSPLLSILLLSLDIFGASGWDSTAIIIMKLTALFVGAGVFIQSASAAYSGNIVQYWYVLLPLLHASRYQ